MKKERCFFGGSGALFVNTQENFSLMTCVTGAYVIQLFSVNID